MRRFPLLLECCHLEIFGLRSKTIPNREPSVRSLGDSLSVLDSPPYLPPLVFVPGIAPPCFSPSSSLFTTSLITSHVVCDMSSHSLDSSQQECQFLTYTCLLLLLPLCYKKRVALSRSSPLVVCTVVDSRSTGVLLNRLIVVRQTDFWLCAKGTRQRSRTP